MEIYWINSVWYSKNEKLHRNSLFSPHFVLFRIYLYLFYYSPYNEADITVDISQHKNVWARRKSFRNVSKQTFPLLSSKSCSKTCNLCWRGPAPLLPVSHSPYCPGHTGTLSYYSAGLSEGWCNVNSRPSDNITKIIQVKEKF